MDSGLDLSRYKTGGEEDNDCGASESGSDKRDSDDKNADANSDLDRKSPENASSRSRRKPAAPQWVNPEWPGDKENQAKEEKNQEPINGVCVRNIPAFKDDSNIVEEETS